MGSPDPWKGVSFANVALFDGRGVSGSMKDGHMMIR